MLNPFVVDRAIEGIRNPEERSFDSVGMLNRGK
jgi:hypothetical protein